MNELNVNKRVSHHDIDFTNHGLEYTLYICLILIMLVALGLDVVFN
ncbi:MAG: hypothetical protein OEY66_09500 [Gammaproteobacteria bacterium]|nr:hypothetical protein [Gammaproteobacteria bacterium]